MSFYYPRASSSPSSSSTTTIQLPSSLKVVGIILAISSGILIGSSFVFKKKGLLRSQAGSVAGEGVAYLKSPLWWCGMTMMILGELCNFVAYSFVEALVVTPMGALSVVISAILSSIFLKETLTFFGWLGCALCIIGSVIIALNGPQEATPAQITAFQKLFLAPGFLAYISVLIAIALSIIFYFGPKYGKDNMIWWITVCSTIGGISVSVTTGLGAAIVTSIMGDNQFKHWFTYFLLCFVAVTLLTEVYYLNVALALFNTAMVTPTYYVLFSFCSMVTTIVLFKGLSAPASQIVTLVLAFVTICIGIVILQMSKIDPVKLTSLDRRSTLLLQAARTHTETPATISLELSEEEKHIAGLEDPGRGALRGSFGTIGSLMRARSSRRISSQSTDSIHTPRGMGIGVGGGMVGNLDGLPFSSLQHTDHTYDGLTRHALYDTPMHSARSDSIDRESQITVSSTQSPRRTAIKWAEDQPAGNRSTQAGQSLRMTSFPANFDSKAPPQFVYPPSSSAYVASSTSSIPHLPPPPGSSGVLGVEDNTGRRTPASAQSIVIPRRANDEPLAPTMTIYDRRADPFQTPSTPSMETFPPSINRDLNLLPSGSPTSIAGDTAEGYGYAGSLESVGSEQTVYATPISTRRADLGAGVEVDTSVSSSPFTDSVPSLDGINRARTRDRRSSSSTSRPRRYPLRGVDDAEERQALWDHQHPSPVEEEVSGLARKQGSEEFSSVRLVRPLSRSGSRF